MIDMGAFEKWMKKMKVEVWAVCRNRTEPRNASKKLIIPGVPE